MMERFLELKNPIQKASIKLILQTNFSDGEFDLIFRTVSALLPIKLAVEALCRRDSNLLTTNVTVNFMLQSLKEQHTSLSEELYITLKNRIEKRHTEIENALWYLHYYNDFKNEREKEKRLSNSNMIKFRVNFIKIFHPQTYPPSEGIGTVVKDDETTTVDSNLLIKN
ncbi:uncharacterized protein TNCV_1939651 [Trichonephila clavipes]|nr:uncharacterized protein TNCV_1939651 [Trichonephila clavipes]